MSEGRVHRKACVLSVGDELVLGQGLDTNSQWISQRLTDLGVEPIGHATIPDDLEGQRDAIEAMAARADLVIATGGLGPTKDDLTRRALAGAMGDALVEDDEALAFLMDIEVKRDRELTTERRDQAMRPSRARMLANAFGTAPGLHGVVNDTDCFCLPGPPREMRPMFETQVLPALRTDPAMRVATRVLRTYGLPEADAGAMLGEIMTRREPSPDRATVGTTASGGIVSVRMRAIGPAADRVLDETERDVRTRLGQAIFGGEDETLASLAVRLLEDRNERVSVAESCTGGLLGAAITGVPGSSAVYDGGYLIYANEAKTSALDVNAELLQKHGAVSGPVAKAMAEGVLASSIGGRAHHALAITGIAGPDGGSEEKPVGTVCIGYAQRGAETEVRRFLIAGDRDDVRARSVTAALGMLTMRLRGVTHPGRVLWEIDS